MTPRREEDPDKATEGEGRGATEDRSGGADSAPPEEKEYLCRYNTTTGQLMKLEEVDPTTGARKEVPMTGYDRYSSDPDSQGATIRTHRDTIHTARAVRSVFAGLLSLRYSQGGYDPYSDPYGGGYRPYGGGYHPDGAGTTPTAIHPVVAASRRSSSRCSRRR